MTNKAFDLTSGNNNDAGTTSPLHEESLALLNRTMNAPAEQKQESSDPLHLAKVASQALLFSALQQPLDGAVQLATWGHVDAPKIVAAPEAAEFGSKTWAAETIGSGIGMVAPFMLSDLAVGKVAAGLKDTSLGAALERMPLATRVEPLAQSVASGGLYGFVLQPSQSKDHLLEDRFKNATILGATMGTQRAVSLGVGKTLGITGESATNGASFAARFATNLVGGAAAGIVNSNADALINQGRFATKQEAFQSVVTFAATGGALDLAHAAVGKLAGAKVESKSGAHESKGTTSSEAVNGEHQTETRASGGSGAMAEVINRIQNGSEADQQAAGLKNSPEVIGKATQFTEEISRAVENSGLTADQQAQYKGQFAELSRRLQVREWDTQGMDRKEIATTYDAVNRVLNADQTAVKMTPTQRIELARQMLEHAADYPRPNTGDSAKNDVLAIMQTLQYKYPGSMSNALADLIISGKHTTPGSAPVTIELSSAHQSFGAGSGPRESYVQSLMHQLGTGAVADVSAPSAETPQLQRMYERLSGTDKGGSVLKNGATFVLRDGDGSFRVYRNDTNYFKFKIGIEGGSVELTNADISPGYQGAFFSTVTLPDSDAKLNLTSKLLVHDNSVDQLIDVTNPATADKTVNVTVAEKVQVPMRDMFEDRGWARTAHGTFAPVDIDAGTNSVTTTYTGLDGKQMQARVQADPVFRLSDTGMDYKMSVKPGETRQFRITMNTGFDGDLQKHDRIESFHQISEKANRQFADWAKGMPEVSSDNPTFNKLWDRVVRDMYMLRQPTPDGEAIAAGIPWFACPFGRDDLITAKQMLPYRSDLARNVLRFMAMHQGTVDDPKTAQKPGKILHEMRMGEMGRNHEIPFAPYYGSADSTPLFLDLIADYTRTTGDMSLFRELRPNIDRALDFLNGETKNGTDYVRYGGHGNEALSNQGWKDSGDSIMNSSGELVKGPIALSEIQGYLYDAWNKMADLYGRAAAEDRATGDRTSAQALEARRSDLTTKAASLKERFGRDFWMPGKNYVALALDGANQQADVVASNPGHILSKSAEQPGLLTPQQESAVASRLMAPDMFSGFGIKTLSEVEARHFDNSYHDGSVWPHDNSMITPGLPPEAKLTVFNGLFDLAKHDPDLRLPELIGGYPRDQFGKPVPYPVACVPQAWAVGTVPSILSDLLGIHVDSFNNHLQISHPLLPDALNQLSLRNFWVGNRRVDLNFNRDSNGQTVARVVPSSSQPEDLNAINVSIKP